MEPGGGGAAGLLGSDRALLTVLAGPGPQCPKGRGGASVRLASLPMPLSGAHTSTLPDWPPPDYSEEYIISEAIP